ncbi:Norsolorinic acid ketoreductase 5 [Colletotrichum chlorophyti]|uniref:Norsolorinic acid ketoreductase 5 n=1 Tax=Colletotrichum chlorophyti TaxID=708187 RepID=A0A1Q8R9H8_9PEZI|nr:Norsolorinic acid ketoreductase 5 [Colletotrichum chlorophyti]
MSTIVLISGANRGLGKGLLERYLKLPNHTIIAANRNPDHATSKELFKLPMAEGTKLIVVKLDSCVWQDAFDAMKTLEDQGINHLDIVIANAGVAYTWPTVAEVKLEDMIAHMEPNAYGVVALFQAVRPLLKKSMREPIYSIMGTTAGSLNTQPALPNACYGPSKSAAAWFSIRINEEENWLHSFSFAPGWVHTDLGDAGAVALGVDEAAQKEIMIGLNESCDGMMNVLAETTKEKHGGKLVVYTGDTMAW